jgi:hypothetical protein
MHQPFFLHLVQCVGIVPVVDDLVDILSAVVGCGLGLGLGG